MKIIAESLIVGTLVNVPVLFILRDHSLQDNVIVMGLVFAYLAWGFSLGFRDGKREKGKQP